MKTVLRSLVLIPLGLVVLLIALANRHEVRFSLDPIQSVNPAVAYDLPLYWLIFASLAGGVLLGGIWTWIGQGQHRKQARYERKEARRWHRAADEANAKLEEITTQQNLGPVSAQAETRRAVALLASDK